MSSTPPQVKICGLTRLDDAKLAVDLGAWALGMIFHDPSPRRCSLREAQRIAAGLRRRVELCGVFVNAHLDTVAETAEAVGLTIVQLHGDEGPAYCAEVARRTGARVVKALQLGGPGDVRELGRYHVDFHLADARGTTAATGSLRGGTGQTFDWKLLEHRRSRVPLIVGGGLRADNVAEAIAATAPFAVDTASGTEAAPGRKDPLKLQAFFAAVAGSGDPLPAPRAQRVA